MVNTKRGGWPPVRSRERVRVLRRSKASVHPISQPASHLAVEPYFLHAPEAVERVVRDEVLDARPLREVVDPPGHGGPRSRVHELALDLLHESQALLRVELLRLLLDQRGYGLVAVARVVAERGAEVVLEEDRVGVVHAVARDVDAEPELLACGDPV